MRQRGRKSAASQDIATISTASMVQRPEPPLDMTPVEEDVWREIVESMPADWFPKETHGLLVQYCRHIVAARKVGMLIDAASSRDQVDVMELDKLLGMQARETGALKAMAAAMRISQQASYSARGAGGAKERRATVKRPWEE